MILIHDMKSLGALPDDPMAAEINRLLTDPDQHGAKVYVPQYFDQYMIDGAPWIPKDRGSIVAISVNNDFVHPLLWMFVEEDRIPQLVQGKHLPLFNEYGIDFKHSIISMMGSRRYGLDDPHSDYDLYVICDTSEELSRMQKYAEKNRVAGGACSVAFTIPELHAGLSNGRRWAWEAATAPADMIAAGKAADQIMPLVKAMVDLVQKTSSWQDNYLQASCRYVTEYGASLLGSPCFEPKGWIRRWKALKGWGFKLGYYIAVDAIICNYVVNHGIFDTKQAVEQSGQRDRLLQYKKGSVTFAEWFDDMSRTMHPKTFQALEKATCKSN